MAEWREQYVCRCESGFWDQSGHTEVTVPVGFHVYWLDDPSSNSAYNRPEMDAKDRQLGHSEVYEGRFSANGFFLHSTGTYYLITDPIYVQSGRAARGEVMYMHVFDLNSGGGARLGLTDGDGCFTGDYARAPFEKSAIEAAVTWGAWQGTYGDGKLPNRQWVKLSAPEMLPTQGHVRLVVQFNLDYAGFGGGHFDVFRVEQYMEQDEPPEPQPGDVMRVEIVGPVVVRIETSSLLDRIGALLRRP